MTIDTSKASGELKQSILRIYNSINQRVWGTGVQQQRVELLRDQILVVALHHRVPALASLDASRRDLTRQVDVALVDLYKSLLKRELEETLGLGIRAIFKDYDPDTQFSVTVALLDQPLALLPPAGVLRWSPEEGRNKARDHQAADHREE